MSKEVMIQTVEKALKDTQFRSMLLKDPKGALSGLSLTREEYSALTQLTSESFDFIDENLVGEPTYVVTAAAACLAGREREATLSRYNLTDFYNLASK